MLKGIGIVLTLFVLLLLGFFAFNQYIYNEKQAKPMETMKTTPTQRMDHASKITPISHATMVLTLDDQVIYTDPVGGNEAFATQKEPTIILITDIHGDHFDPDTLTAITTERTILVVPQAVADELPKSLPGTIVVLANGEKTTQHGVEIEAIPMYNVPESADTFHTKGRGNGYVVSMHGERIYIAGDTAVTPEMKALKDIDIAFIPMNLPYTMSVEAAAGGVLAFKPKVVHPYHYRGPQGLADIKKFKELVENGDPNITVELLNFYPEK